MKDRGGVRRGIIMITDSIVFFNGFPKSALTLYPNHHALTTNHHCVILPISFAHPLTHYRHMLLFYHPLSSNGVKLSYPNLVVTVCKSIHLTSISPWFISLLAKFLWAAARVEALVQRFLSMVPLLEIKGNRTIADLRYGEKDIMSPSTLIFALIKS